MKKASVKTVIPQRTQGRTVTDPGRAQGISSYRLKELAFLSALLLVLAALLGLYVAWVELNTPGGEELVI